jgi:WD40 repeat protein
MLVTVGSIVSNELERSKISLQAFHPRTLHLAKIVTTSLQSRERQFQFDPLQSYVEIQKRGLEAVFDEALLNEDQYKQAWLQCIHLFRRLSPTLQDKYFLSIWHNQCIQLGWLDISERIEQYFFDQQLQCLIGFSDSTPKPHYCSLIEAHLGSIHQLQFGSNDVLASGDWKGETTLWDLRTNRIQWKFQHSSGVKALKFSSDDSRVVIASMDGTISVVTASTGQIEKQLHLSAQAVSCISTSNDDSTIAIGSRDGKIQYWNHETNLTQPEITVSKECLSFVHFSGDDYIFVGLDNGSIQCRDSNTNILHWQTSLTSVRLTACTTSLDDCFIAIGTYDGTIYVLNTQTGDSLVHFSVHTQQICSLYFDHTGNILHAASLDGSISTWSKETGQIWCKIVCDDNLSFHILHPDGYRWATGHQSGDIRLWNRQKLTVSQYDIANITAVACSESYRWILCGDILGKVHLWKQDTSFVRTVINFEASIQSIAMTQDEELHTHLSNGNTYCDEKRTEITSLPAKFSFFSTHHRQWIFLSWNGTITVSTLSNNRYTNQPKDGRLTAYCQNQDIVCLGFADGSVVIFNWKENKELHSLQIEDKSVCSLAYSSQKLFIGYEEGTMVVWDTSIQWQQQASSKINSAVFTNEGNIYVCLDEGIVQLLSATSFIPLISQKHPHLATLLPGGRLLFVANQQMHFITLSINKHRLE